MISNYYNLRRNRVLLLQKYSVSCGPLFKAVSNYLPHLVVYTVCCSRTRAFREFPQKEEGEEE